MNNYKLGSGNYYHEITRVMVVNLNWYPGKIGENIIGKKIYEIPYSDMESDGYLLKIVNVNLDYYSKKCYDKLDTIDKFYKLMTIKDKEELDKIVEYEKMLENYGKKLKKLSNDNNYVEDIMSEEIEEFVEQHRMYHKGLKAGIEQGIQQGIEQGVEQGFQEGIRENQTKIVLNMSSKNISCEDIAEITNLSIKEIEKIIKEKK